MPRRSQTPDARPRTDQPLPYVLTPGELRAIVGLGSSRCAARQKAGCYRELQLEAVDGVVRYSGLRVERWLRGEVLEARPPLRAAGRSPGSRGRALGGRAG